jgi:hypothetical protein
MYIYGPYLSNCGYRVVKRLVDWLHTSRKTKADMGEGQNRGYSPHPNRQTAGQTTKDDKF